jgi:hypothetical protein
MINLPLTDEVMNLARMLIYQARLPICDCGCDCNCLEIHSVKADVCNVIIQTKHRAYRLQAVWINESL